VVAGHGVCHHTADAVALPSSVWMPRFRVCWFGSALGLNGFSVAGTPKGSSDPSGFRAGPIRVGDSAPNSSVKWDRMRPRFGGRRAASSKSRENGTPISKELDTAQLQNVNDLYDSTKYGEIQADRFFQGAPQRPETAEWRP